VRRGNTRGRRGKNIRVGEEKRGGGDTFIGGYVNILRATEGSSEKEENAEQRAKQEGKSRRETRNTPKPS